MNEKTKLLIPADSEAWHGKSGERLWVTTLSDGTYRLENSPLYALGLSYKDVVSAKRNCNGDLEFERVVARGGHSTFHVVLRGKSSKQDFSRLWQELEAMGCTYESTTAPEVAFAIDVPPLADVQKIYSILERGESEGAWEFGEGFIGHDRNDG